MSDRILSFERQITHVREAIRIFYFLSDDRDVIKDAVNSSIALQCNIGGRWDDRERLAKSYEQMAEDGDCVRFDTLYTNESIEYEKEINDEKFEAEKAKIPEIMTITDFHIYTEAERAHMVKAFLDSKHTDSVLLISSSESCIPKGFENEIAVIEDGYPTTNDILERIGAKVREEEKLREIDEKDIPSDEEMEKAAKKFTGWTTAKVENALYLMEGSLCPKIKDGSYARMIDEERIKEAKADGIVEFVKVPKEKSVGGAEKYLKWLEARKDYYFNPEEAERRGTPAPKGVMFCGVPGTGKTAMAAESARILGTQCVKLDISTILTSELGGSEANLSRWLKTIDAYGSCVVALDEVEKLFATEGKRDTHEVTQHLLNMLLQWMQEREGNAYLFLTANSIEGLPQAFLRRGRIDAKFFAFLPSCKDLADILRLKLRKGASRTGDPMYDEEFRRIINNEYDDRLCEIFNETAQEAEKKGRYPFMTGADVEGMLQDTLTELDAKRRERKVSYPYSFKDFKAEMVNYAMSDIFVPQASNTDDIVKTWRQMQRNGYVSIAEEPLIPFSELRDGKFTEESKKNRGRYDDYLVRTIKKKIEEKIEEEEKYKKAVDKMGQ